jgi:hypothetical protein
VPAKSLTPHFVSIYYYPAKKKETQKGKNNTNKNKAFEYHLMNTIFAQST